MARPNKIWYWEARGEWCVKIDSVRHRLGPDKAEAERKFHELMCRPEEPKPQVDAVATIIDLFLDWTKKNRAEASFDWYQKRLQSFLDSLDPKTLPVGKLKAHHVHTWVDSHKTWGDTHRRGAMIAVCRCFNWAERLGHIVKSPVRGVEKPAAESPDLVIDPGQFTEILTYVKGGFRDLLITAWDTGCRPQELLRVEARHVEVKHSRWVFPVKESKGKKLPRIVYLSERVLQLVQELMKAHPTGPLFRNEDGEPWSAMAVNCCFLRLQSAMGKAKAKTVSEAAITARMTKLRKQRVQKKKPPLPEWKLKCVAREALQSAEARSHAPKYCMYTIRRSYCTNGLKSGTDPVTMGKLMSHKDLTMIYKIYAKIAQDPVFMLAAARKVVK